MPLLTLAHGPLVGPGTRDTLAPALPARGQGVLVPDLARTLASGPC
jgi:hypothetical protein